MTDRSILPPEISAALDNDAQSNTQLLLMSRLHPLCGQPVTPALVDEINKIVCEELAHLYAPTRT